MRISTRAYPEAAQPFAAQNRGPQTSCCGGHNNSTEQTHLRCHAREAARLFSLNPAKVLSCHPRAVHVVISVRPSAYPPVLLRATQTKREMPHSPFESQESSTSSSGRFWLRKLDALWLCIVVWWMGINACGAPLLHSSRSCMSCKFHYTLRTLHFPGMLFPERTGSRPMCEESFR
jgi:hypothetical protein